MIDLNIKWVCNQIGLVSQEPVLSNISIGENIKLGKSEAPQADIVEAAKEANANDSIMSSPDN